MDAYAIATGCLAITTVGATYKWAMAAAESAIEKINNGLLHEDIAGLRADKTRLYTLFDEIEHTHAIDLQAADHRAKKQDDLIRKQGREIAEFRAVRAKQLQGGAKGRATQTARKLEREAKSKALHDGMQAEIDATRAILDQKEAA